MRLSVGAALAAAAASLLVAVTPAGHAAAGGPGVDPSGPGTVETWVEEAPGSGGGGGGGEVSPGGAGGGGGSGESPPPTILDPRVLFRDGGACVVAGSQPGDPGSALAVDLEVRYLRLRGLYGPCAGDGPPAGPAGPPGPGAAIAAWADQVDLPEPVPVVRAGLGVVGKAVYLEIAGTPAERWLFDALGWSITIDGTSTYEVDWGDGTVDAGVTSQGGPWPLGEVRHTYDIGGDRTIEVTQRWTVEWTAMGHGQVRAGSIDDLLWTAGALDLPVHEVQAVRDR